MQFSFFFELFDLEKFPKVDWMILYQDPDKYARYKKRLYSIYEKGFEIKVHA